MPQNALGSAGLNLARVEEPGPLPDALALRPALAEGSRRPHSCPDAPDYQVVGGASRPSRLEGSTGKSCSTCFG